MPTTTRAIAVARGHVAGRAPVVAGQARPRPPSRRTPRPAAPPPSPRPPAVRRERLEVVPRRLRQGGHDGHDHEGRQHRGQAELHPPRQPEAGGVHQGDPDDQGGRHRDGDGAPAAHRVGRRSARPSARPAGHRPGPRSRSTTRRRPRPRRRRRAGRRSRRRRCRGTAPPSRRRSRRAGCSARTRAAQATSEAGPAIPAAMAGRVMTPVPSTAPIDSAVPWGTLSPPAVVGAAGSWSWLQRAVRIGPARRVHFEPD